MFKVVFRVFLRCVHLIIFFKGLVYSFSHYGLQHKFDGFTQWQISEH